MFVFFFRTSNVHSGFVLHSPLTERKKGSMPSVWILSTNLCFDEMILNRDVWVYSTSGTTSRTSEIYIPADLFKRQLDVQPLNTQVTKTIKKASTVFPSHHSHLFATFHCSPKDAFSDLSNEVTFRKESTFPTSICITTSHSVEE